MQWLAAVEHLRSRREPGVLVTLALVRGHSPRAAGAKMVVGRDGTWGSIGGGNLEATAVERARDLLDRPGSEEPSMFVADLSDKARVTHGVQCCGGEVTVLLEPLAVPTRRRDLRDRPRRPGAGAHPGPARPRPAPGRLALRAAHRRGPGRPRRRRGPGARPPRAGAPRAGPGRAACRHPRPGDDPRPRGGRRAVRRGAALRAPRPDRPDRLAGQVGTVPQELADEGHEPAAIARITTPIGAPGLRGKDPATIALAVASSLLQAFEDEAAAGAVPVPSRPGSSVDALPRDLPGHPGEPVRRRHPAVGAGRRDLRARRRDRRTGCLRHGPGAPSRRRRRRPERRPGPAGVRRHARALPAGADDRCAGHAAPGLARAQRAARGGPPGRRRLRQRGRRRVPRRAVGGRHHDRARLRRPLLLGGRRPLRAGGAARAADHQRPRGERPRSCGRTCSPRRSGPSTRAGRWPGAGTASDGCATP